MSQDQTGIEDQIAGIASLEEPVRRALYFYVAERPGSVTRDEAAGALGIKRALAAFHLDKLVEEGLLEAHYRRLTGRRGPGAGRPSKLYRRSGRQYQVSLPPRNYELAARLFADALSDTRSAPAVAALHEVARTFGAGLGSEARELSPDQMLVAAQDVLRAYGYEPFDQDGTIRLRNCPFHVLSTEHRGLVCGMNLTLMQGFCQGLGASLEAVLDPQPGMCCVAFRPVA